MIFTKKFEKLKLNEIPRLTTIFLKFQFYNYYLELQDLMEDEVTIEKVEEEEETLVTRVTGLEAKIDYIQHQVRREIQIFYLFRNNFKKGPFS